MSKRELIDHREEEGLSLKHKVFLSIAVVIATLLLCSVPYPFSIEPVWVIPVGIFTLLSLWLAVTSRFFAELALACLVGILYAFFLQAFEVRYLYQFPLKDGRMFQANPYYAYHTLFRSSEWITVLPAAVAAAFVGALNTVTVRGRLHHRICVSINARSSCFLKGSLAAVSIGAILGLFIGWARYHFGFIAGIQGMFSGLLLGLITAPVLAKYSRDCWIWQYREIVLAIGLAGFLIFQLIGIGLSQSSFAPHHWLEGMLNGDMQEYVHGYTRYRWHAYLFRPGPLGWMLFNILDVVFLVFMTLVLMFNRVKSPPDSH